MGEEGRIQFSERALQPGDAVGGVDELGDRGRSDGGNSAQLDGAVVGYVVPPHALDFAAIRTSSLTAATELIRRAKDTGRLRPDIMLDDIILMVMANNGIHASTPAARLAASRRFAALMIQAFEASPRSAPLPPLPRLMPAVSVPRHKSNRPNTR
ncbi:hypothetical protein [Nocardia sp. CA-135398]|uniref:hypothetical protein n=1 Tax=Nocardia sp. CA-135398 TaxID=3239977 RepID=UPI003D99B92D